MSEKKSNVATIHIFRGDESTSIEVCGSSYSVAAALAQTFEHLVDKGDIPRPLAVSWVNYLRDRI